MTRNAYARSLRIHAQQIIPDKREKTYRDHLNDTANEEVPEHLKRLLDDLD